MTRVVFLSEIPTPYRIPFFEQIARRDDLDLTVLYCARSEPDRPWELKERVGEFPHEFLPGIALPIRTRRNTFVYEINVSVISRLRRLRPDILVVGGYGVFAEQAAILYATATGLPWVLHSESHLLRRRSTTLRTAKHVILGAALRRAAGGLAVGTAAAEYLMHYGIPEDRVKILPNTIDVPAYADAARAALADHLRIRAERSLPESFQLFVGRLVADKGVEDLLAARRHADFPPLVVAGEGPLRGLVAEEPNTLLLGFQGASSLIELYALAERTVVPSRIEPWGVVVNEALACGSPVVTTDAVGAAIDLVRSGQDGLIVRAGDIPELRAALGQPIASHEPGTGPIGQWTYEFGAEQFMNLIHTLGL